MQVLVWYNIPWTEYFTKHDCGKGLNAGAGIHCLAGINATCMGAEKNL